MIDSPSIVPDDLEEWMALIEQKAAAGAEITITPPVMMKLVERFRKTSETLRIYSNAQSQKGASPKKRSKYMKRNVEMAREFKRRILYRDVSRGGRSDTQIKSDIGRLPRFNLKPSAANEAIDKGLAEIERLQKLSGDPGIPD